MPYKPLMPCANLSINDLSMNHRYILASTKAPKLTCPHCEAKKHWQQYIDADTNEVLPPPHGRCDNEVKCGKWITPWETGYAAKDGNHHGQPLPALTKVQAKNNHANPIIKQPPTTTYFDWQEYRKTLIASRYEHNAFIQNLLHNVPYPFPPEVVTKIVQLYYLGTVEGGYMAGAITFPFIDVQGNIRAVQVKNFDHTNHTTKTNFLHSILAKEYKSQNKPEPDWLSAYIGQEKYVTCLFGAHLLRQFPNNPVVLVEAPKTAIYGTLYFGIPESPNDYIWLAVFNKSAFTYERLKVLKGRKVLVVPDLSKDGETYAEWEAKALEIEKSLPGSRFEMSDLLELLAADKLRTAGADIGDILIEHDWRSFRSPHESKHDAHASKNPGIEVNGTLHYAQENPNPILVVRDKEVHDALPLRMVTPQKPVNPNETMNSWSEELKEIELAFSNLTVPNAPVPLDACTTITIPSFFIETHLRIVKAHNGNKVFQPYMNRLQKLRQILQGNQ